MEKAFWASRYDKGEADYLNCPMNEEEYNRFYNALISAELIDTKDFEKKNFLKVVCLSKLWPAVVDKPYCLDR